MAFFCLDGFKKQDKLIQEFGSNNAFMVWALAMYLDEPDPEALGAEALTDQPNDKKLDFLYLDKDNKRIVFAQGYVSSKANEQAPANKASDLNTAVAWMISGDLKNVPPELADSIREARRAIDTGDVESIELLYVHNLPSSQNVANELETVKAHLSKGIPADIKVNATELGIEQIERLYVAKESQLEVTEELVCPAQIKLEESGPMWKAGVATVSAEWLQQIHEKYGKALFSANYRGFLGLKRKKINSGIKQTAETDPKNFWVFNNGVSVLTLGYSQKDEKTVLQGISIINGAQTTGSLGTAEKRKGAISPSVMVRIIECKDQDTIKNIVRFNNTQNEITTWDQYSNSEDQTRISGEFKNFGHAYWLKRGFGEALSGMGIEVVAQPLLAFQGDFQTANRGKNGIFDRKANYNKAFEGKTARHILFVYSLAKAIDKFKQDLKEKHRAGKLIDIEEKQMSLVRNLNFKHFFIALVARVLDTVLDKKIDSHTIAFDPNTSDAKNKTISELVDIWMPVVRTIASLLPALMKTEISEMVSDEAAMKDLSASLAGLVLATRDKLPLEEFKKVVTPN